MCKKHRQDSIRFRGIAHAFAAVVLNSFANLLGDDLPKFVKLSPGLARYRFFSIILLFR